MANAVASRIGSINSATDKDALFLKVFSSEVLATFMRENKMLGMTSVRSISSGKSAQFPVIGTTSAAYHTVGNEIVGTEVKHAEKIISIDDLLLSSAFLANLDKLFVTSYRNVCRLWCKFKETFKMATLSQTQKRRCRDYNHPRRTREDIVRADTKVLELLGS